VPWLDGEIARRVQVLIATVAEQHPELRAAILYGSLARHEERSLDDSHPRDVDLLLLFDVAKGQSDVPLAQYVAIFAAIGQARDQYPVTPREVEPLPVLLHLAHWDAGFVENVARDGLLQWARAPLPPALSAVGFRTAIP
jgi:hypothetical protein